MRDYLIKRILLAIGVIFAISAITFFVLNIVPGDPVRVMVGDMADEATIQRIREQMGLNKPVLEQFANWLGNMLHGDFGTSYTQRKAVVDLMGNAFGTTVKLAGFAYIFALADTAHVAIAAPIISAYCVASVVWSRIFLKEKLSWKHYAMIALVVVGIVLLGFFDI